MLASISACSIPGTQAPASARSQADKSVVEGLARKAAEGNSAFMRGDMRAWSSLLPLEDDILLMTPFGGPPSRGFDSSDENLARLSRYFTSGTTGPHHNRNGRPE
jgi:hypothetical protein